jgi:hypothetical protein
LDLNQEPNDYESFATYQLSYGPIKLLIGFGLEPSGMRQQQAPWEPYPLYRILRLSIFPFPYHHKNYPTSFSENCQVFCY